jgi:hypothetical protein
LLKEGERMMKGKLFILLVFVFILGITQVKVNAAFVSGNMLAEWMKGYEACEATKDYTQYGQQASLYLGFIEGVVDSTEFTKVWEYPSKDVTGSQLMSVVAKYLKAHPEKLKDPAFALVIQALNEAFPIKKQSKK